MKLPSRIVDISQPLDNETVALPRVACFPCKIKGASGGWTRAVALFD